eukprot:GHVS01002356.1.p1 GENE.GHVS01002356.1~~GHVS01002356.1.p1  ORF type:complete len:179 (-),score=46.37 GHVS01002356.1:141-677(-)
MLSKLLCIVLLPLLGSVCYIIVSFVQQTLPPNTIGLFFVRSGDTTYPPRSRDGGGGGVVVQSPKPPKAVEPPPTGFSAMSDMWPKEETNVSAAGGGGGQSSSRRGMERTLQGSGDDKEADEKETTSSTSSSSTSPSRPRILSPIVNVSVYSGDRQQNSFEGNSQEVGGLWLLLLRRFL